MGDNSQRLTWIFMISTQIPWLWGRAAHRLASLSSALEYQRGKGLKEGSWLFLTCLMGATWYRGKSPTL